MVIFEVQEIPITSDMSDDRKEVVEKLNTRLKAIIDECKAVIWVDPMSNIEMVFKAYIDVNDSDRIRIVQTYP